MRVRVPLESQLNNNIIKYIDIVNSLDLVPCELEFNNKEFNISAEFLLSEDNLRRIHEFNKLLNVAKYLNGSEELSLNDKKTFKYYIQYRIPDKKIIL